MNQEIQYASSIDIDLLKQHLKKDFADKFLGVDFEYISAVTAQRVNAQPEIELFIERAIDLACKATWVNAALDEGYSKDIDDIDDELLRKLAQ
jgi:hypothetical protein